jgi:hypothetical protein
MHFPEADRSRLQIKRMEDGRVLSQNDAMYIEESMKITQTN